MTQEEIDQYFLDKARGMQNMQPSWQIAQSRAAQLEIDKARNAYQAMWLQNYYAWLPPKHSLWHRYTAYCKKFIARLIGK